MTPRGASNITKLSDGRSGTYVRLDITYAALGAVLPQLGTQAFDSLVDELPAVAFMSESANRAVQHLVEDARMQRAGQGGLKPRTGPPTRMNWMTFDRCLERTDPDTVGEIAATAARLAVEREDEELWMLGFICEYHDERSADQEGA